MDCDASWLRVDSNVIQPAERIAATDYPAFRSFWQAVDADLNATVAWPRPQPPMLLMEAAWRGHEPSGPPLPAVEAGQRERPKQKVAEPPAASTP
jgi:hypothetical protein